MDVFSDLESEVRSYCRNWPAVFSTARGSTLTSEDGTDYLDFFSGAGALNYGHNHPHLISALIEYITSGGVIHSLDMSTVAKRKFLETFNDTILSPRGLEYRIQFPGPTGTNSVEAAMKLARKVTGRENIVSFTNAFHGMTLGALAVTGNSMKRDGAGIPLSNTTAMPYCDYLDDGSSLAYLDAVLTDSGSGLDLPAAVIVETTQGEGGLKVASRTWLRELAEVCKRHDVLLIVDDIQMGCGRTGSFFSFEFADISPDIVCLSKSLSGSGLPLAITLIRPELDVWEPGEHNGTFRGNNPAFVTATAALDLWRDSSLETSTTAKAEYIERFLIGLATEFEGAGADIRGRGLAQGIVFDDPTIATRVCADAYSKGLLMETSGPESEVVKLFPAITISDSELERGLQILGESIEAALPSHAAKGATA